MSATNNLLGVDYGEARVGLAYAGGDGPVRLRTLENTPHLIGDILIMVAEREITTIVVGLPRNSDGDDTPWTTQVRRFMRQLQDELPGVRVVAQDEFGTSAIARERIGAKAVSDRRLVDQEAAVIILEDYIRDHSI